VRLPQARRIFLPLVFFACYCLASPRVRGLRALVSAVDFALGLGTPREWIHLLLHGWLALVLLPVATALLEMER
jgi:hypothetical protein